MIDQYKILLSVEKACTSRQEWGYHLYSALMEKIPSSCAESLHQDGVTPVSQFLTRNGEELIWTVNLLGDECCCALGPAIENLEQIFLRKHQLRLQVLRREKVQIADVEELFALSQDMGQHQLKIITSTAFKSRGAYRILPDSRLILQSLMKKWNGAFPECIIEDTDGEGLEAMEEGLAMTGFFLKDKAFRLKGKTIPGFVGELTLNNELEGFHRRLADALLLFADYAGIGIKTALGMGGVRHGTVNGPGHLPPQI